MENVPGIDLFQTAARKTSSFIPVPVRRSDPILERCYVPTVDSAYLKLTDSVTSFNSSTSSSMVGSHIVESHLSNRPPQSESSLAAPCHGSLFLRYLLAFIMHHHWLLPIQLMMLYLLRNLHLR